MLDHPAPALDLTARLHAAGVAAQTLRRGLPAVLAAPDPIAVLAIETADEAGLEAFQRMASGPALLVLSPARAAELADSQALEPAGLGLAALRALTDPTLPQLDRVPPGAILPPGAEAALALAVLARLLPGVLIAPAHGRIGIPAGDVLSHAALTASAVMPISSAAVPLEDAADARMVAFRAPGSDLDHYAVLIGRPEDADAPLVRVHSECFTGDLLGSLRCDCGSQLRGAIRRMAAEGAGAVLYMAQEGRGIGLANKLRAYTLQDRGLDTLDANCALGFAADERDFMTAAAMLRHLGLRRVRLLTNNPDKLAGLGAHGIEVAGRESLLFASNGVNDRYLQTKTTRFGHLT